MHGGLHQVTLDNSDGPIQSGSQNVGMHGSGTIRHRITKRFPLPRPAAAPEQPARAVLSLGADVQASKKGESGGGRFGAGSETAECYTPLDRVFSHEVSVKWDESHGGFWLSSKGGTDAVLQRDPHRASVCSRQCDVLAGAGVRLPLASPSSILGEPLECA